MSGAARDGKPKRVGCWKCFGSGQYCATCGEVEAACECKPWEGDEMDLMTCDVCGGTGEIDDEKEGC